MQGGDGLRPACRVLASPRYLAAFQPKQVPHFFTDILVIGSGLAGLRAALGVDQKLSVLVVTKDELHSSNSDRAQGGVAAVLGADDCFEDHVADTLIAGGTLCAPEVVRYVVQEAPRRVIELIEWGAKFDQNGSRLALTREGGHRRNRIVHAHGDATGREIVRALTQRVFQAATYVPMHHGFMDLAAIMDWYSRYVLAWRVSNTLETRFCLDALDEALERHGTPEIFNTDQGSQFTSEAFTGRLEAAGIAISMDGRKRALDNVFVERLWRSVKYEDIYLKDYATADELIEGLGHYFTFYDHERVHQALDYRTPWEVYSEGLAA